MATFNFRVGLRGEQTFPDKLTQSTIIKKRKKRKKKGKQWQFGANIPVCESFNSSDWTPPNMKGQSRSKQASFETGADFNVIFPGNGVLFNVLGRFCAK